MVAHTPGPWSIGIEGNNRVCGPDGMGEHSGLIAVVYKGRSNARLIAAAPDLLAMLKLAHLCLDVDGRFDMQGINAAIAKAEGRS